MAETVAKVISKEEKRANACRSLAKINVILFIAQWICFHCMFHTYHNTIFVILFVVATIAMGVIAIVAVVRSCLVKKDSEFRTRSDIGSTIAVVVYLPTLIALVVGMYL